MPARSALIKSPAAAFKTDWPVGGVMKAFRVSGIAPFGKQRQGFSIDLPAEDDGDAKHRAYSILGPAPGHSALDRHPVDSGNRPRTSQEPTVLHHFRDQIAAAGGPVAVAEEE